MLAGRLISLTHPPLQSFPYNQQQSPPSWHSEKYYPGISSFVNFQIKKEIVNSDEDENLTGRSKKGNLNLE
jgi:hypothetical protein